MIAIESEQYRLLLVNLHRNQVTIFPCLILKTQFFKCKQQMLIVVVALQNTLIGIMWVEACNKL